MDNKIEELKKNPISFIEDYIVINGEHIILHDYQKKLINWLLKLKK